MNSFTGIAFAAPYGSCSYSDGRYGSGENCESESKTQPGSNNQTDSKDPSGPLSTTGENYFYLVSAAIGLLIFAGAGLLLVRLIKKRKSHSSKQG